MSFAMFLLAVARNSLGFAPNVLLTPENSRDFMQVQPGLGPWVGEKTMESKGGFFFL
jgi:hypothetical protein